MSIRKEVLAENVTLYLGDCREVMPTLTRPAAIISDPPYGQRLKANAGRRQGDKGRAHRNSIHSHGRVTAWPDQIIGDDQEFDPDWLIDAADIVLLWGEHRFGNRLPAGTTLVWDKVPTGGASRDQGDGETAWLNAYPARPLRIYRLLWMGLCVGGSSRHEVSAGQQRVHPTQKPVELMEWCVREARVPTKGVICDPYMGSGSTGIASVRSNFGFIGCEIEPLYFDTACRRIADELRRPRLFAEPIAKPVQEVMFS